MAFDLFHVKFKYTLAILTGIIGLFPLIPGFVIFIPIVGYFLYMGMFI